MVSPVLFGVAQSILFNTHTNNPRTKYFLQNAWLHVLLVCLFFSALKKAHENGAVAVGFVHNLL